MAPSKLFSLYSPASLFVYLSFFAFVQGQPAPVNHPPPIFPPKSTPVYGVQIQTVYAADKSRGILGTLIFTENKKELWKAQARAAFNKAMIAKETGMCFCEVGYPAATEIRGYTKNGKRIMTQRGSLLGLSYDGNFVAFRPLEAESGGKNQVVLVVNPKENQAFQFKPDEGFTVKAVGNDGKTLFVGKDETKPAAAEYRLVDRQGKLIWGQKGRGQWGGAESHGNRILFFRTKEKTVDYCDFKTGKLLDEMPLWKFTALHNPAVSSKP